jgi:ERI1 exoribonuclease 3
MVENESDFSEVLSDFDKWVFKEDPGKFTFVICGDWDLKTMLPKQCQASGINVPDYMRQWINIKKSYHMAKRIFPRSLPVRIEFNEF